MNCVICRHGEPRTGTTTVTLERGSVTLVFKGVPALVCPNCGEAFVEQDTAERLLLRAERAVGSGVEVEITTFAA